MRVILLSVLMLAVGCNGGGISKVPESGGSETSACTLADAISNGVVPLDSNSAVQGNKVGSDVSACLLDDAACDLGFDLALDKLTCIANPMDITLDRAELEYSVFNLTDISVAPATTIAGPAVAGAVAVGTGSSSALTGSVPTSSLGSITLTPAVAVVPASFPVYYAGYPKVAGEFVAAIGACTLEDITVKPCTIVGSTFEASPSIADLTGLTTVELIVDYETLQVPVKKTEFRKVFSSCGSGPSDVVFLAKLGTTAYYRAKVGTVSCADKMIRVDAAGTATLVANIINDMSLPDTYTAPTVFNNELYFGGLVAANVHKLFKVDAAGVVTQVSNTTNNQATNDAYNPSGFANPSSASMMEFNGELYVVMRNPNDQLKLHKIDAAGVVTQVSNTVNDQTISDNASLFAIFDNKLYFKSHNTNTQLKLYSVDSSGVVTQATNLTNDQTTGDYFGGSDIYYVFNNKLYFMARNASNWLKLFAMDTSGAVVQALDMIPGTNDAMGGFMLWGGEMYFTGSGDLYKMALDGSVTKMSDTWTGGIDNAYLKSQFVIDDNAYFVSQTASVRNKLFSIGDDGVIRQVANLRGDATTDMTNLLGVSGDNLYFYARNSLNAQKVFRYNDALGEMTELSDMAGDRTVDDSPQGFVELNGIPHIAMWSGGGYELFRIETTP